MTRRMQCEWYKVRNEHAEEVLRGFQWCQLPRRAAAIDVQPSGIELCLDHCSHLRKAAGDTTRKLCALWLNHSVLHNHHR
jgi:hypothetical protein